MLAFYGHLVNLIGHLWVHSNAEHTFHYFVLTTLLEMTIASPNCQAILVTPIGAFVDSQIFLESLEKKVQVAYESITDDSKHYQNPKMVWQWKCFDALNLTEL